MDEAVTKIMDRCLRAYALMTSAKQADEARLELDSLLTRWLNEGQMSERKLALRAMMHLYDKVPLQR